MIVENWEVDDKTGLVKDSTIYENSFYLAKNDKEKAISSITLKEIIFITYQQKKICKVYYILLLF